MTSIKNPFWTKEETILALDLYFDLNQNIPGPSNKKIIELSKHLNKMTLHDIEKRTTKFRSPASVVQKLHNIRFVATGNGRKNHSNMDEIVWNEYSNNRMLIKQIAENIKKGLSINDNIITYINQNYIEGKEIIKQHKLHERNINIRKDKIKQLKAQDKICCEICGIKPYFHDDKIMYSIFECHHIILLSERCESITHLDDIAFLCSNCHNLIHKIITVENRWFDITGIKNYIKNKKVLFNL